MPEYAGLPEALGRAADAPSHGATVRAIRDDPGLAAVAAAFGAHRRSAALAGRPADPAHDAGHVARVACWAAHVARVEGGTPATVREALAAALLHDLTAVPKDHPDRARASGMAADAAGPICVGAGFAPDAAGRIADAVRTHSFSRGETPRDLVGHAVRDADRLDALGALGILRATAVGTLAGARLLDPDDPWAEYRPLDDAAFSIDHHGTKLLRLADGMGTATGRTEAMRRTGFLRDFLAQLGSEIGRARPDPREP